MNNDPHPNKDLLSSARSGGSRGEDDGGGEETFSTMVDAQLGLIGAANTHSHTATTLFSALGERG